MSDLIKNLTAGEALARSLLVWGFPSFTTVLFLELVLWTRVELWDPVAAALDVLGRLGIDAPIRFTLAVFVLVILGGHVTTPTYRLLEGLRWWPPQPLRDRWQQRHEAQVDVINTAVGILSLYAYVTIQSRDGGETSNVGEANRRLVEKAERLLQALEDASKSAPPRWRTKRTAINVLDGLYVDEGLPTGADIVNHLQSLQRPRLAQDFSVGWAAPRGLLPRHLDYPTEAVRAAPTRLGNRLSSMEAAPFEMFSVRLLTLWDQLYTGAPEEARKAVDRSRLAADSRVAWLCSLAVLSMASLVAAVVTADPLTLLLAPLIVTFALFILRGLPGSVDLWHEAVVNLVMKARKPVVEELGLQLPTSHREETRLWEMLANTAYYQSGDAAAALDAFRVKQDKDPDDDAQGIVHQEDVEK